MTAPSESCLLPSPSRRSLTPRSPPPRRVKDILSYLQLVDNPSYTAAFSRIINVPKRGIGEKTTHEMLNIAKKKGWTAWDVAVKLAKGSGVVNVTSMQRKGVREFVKVVSEMRAAAEEVS